jgi:hypothetical protein
MKRLISAVALSETYARIPFFNASGEWKLASKSLASKSLDVTTSCPG